MPQCHCYNPKTLCSICLEYVTVNIHGILENEEMIDEGNSSKCKFQELPETVYHLVSDKILDNGVLHDNNYKKILSTRTRNILLGGESCMITNPYELLDFMKGHCKNVVKICLIVPLFTRWREVKHTKSTLIGLTLASMVHLEWIDLRFCEATNECLKYIGSKCQMLKHLNVEFCPDITDEGILALCDSSLTPSYGNCSKLTYLNIRNNTWVTPQGLSMVLLHCPDLEFLEHHHFEAAMWLAFNHVAILNGSTPSRTTFTERVFSMCCCKGKGSPQGPFSCKEMNGHSNKNLEQRIFKIRNMSVNNTNEPFLIAVTQHCPLLENLTLSLSGPAVCSNRGIHDLLMLRTLNITGSPRGNPLNLEDLFFPSPAGFSLTALRLYYQTNVPLSVISRCCPNLEALTLYYCDTMEENRTVPVVLTLNSLNNLTICSSLIEVNDLTSLLLSPKLETILLDFEDRIDQCMHPTLALEEVLTNSQDAFTALKTALFEYIEMNSVLLSTFLDRAVALETLIIGHCYSNNGGEHILYNDKDYFDDIIQLNHWKLLCEWS